MTVRVLNTKALTNALKVQLEQWPKLADAGVTVESNMPINATTSRCPWIGIYQVSQNLPSKTLGMGSGFRRHRIQIALVLNESSMVSGEECEENMELLVSETLSALLSDYSIGGVVDVIDDQISVTYSSYRIEGNSFFKEAVIQFGVVTTVLVV